jgi:hypothetical protein
LTFYGEQEDDEKADGECMQATTTIKLYSRLDVLSRRF